MRCLSRQGEKAVARETAPTRQRDRTMVPATNHVGIASRILMLAITVRENIIIDNDKTYIDLQQLKTPNKFRRKFRVKYCQTSEGDFRV